LEKIEKDIKKEQEKEIEFVVGGVYESAQNKLCIYKVDGKSTFDFIMLNKYIRFNIQRTKKDILRYLKEFSYKYTGRTLSDIINK
jgi:hypothetical protein